MSLVFGENLPKRGKDCKFVKEDEIVEEDEVVERSALVQTKLLLLFSSM